MRSSDLKLIADLRLLDDKHREIVREFVRILVRSYRCRASSEALQHSVAVKISDDS